VIRWGEGAREWSTGKGRGVGNWRKIACMVRGGWRCTGDGCMARRGHCIHCAGGHRSCRFTSSLCWLGSSGSVAHARLALSNLHWAEIMCCSIYMYASLYYSYSYNCCNRSKQSSHTLLLIVGFCYAPSSLLRFRTRGLSLAQRTSLHILPSCRRDAVL